MATGQLGPDQLARFAEILAALAREPVFRVVLIHHPPIPNPGHYMKRLIDGPIFRALLAEHGAELLLHGHNHEQQLRWLDGPRGRIPAIGVPSASAMISDHDEPAAYNIYRIAGGPGAWQCDMVSRGLRAGPAQPEPDEVIHVRMVPLSAAVRMVMRGAIKDGKTISGILWLSQSRESSKPHR